MQMIFRAQYNCRILCMYEFFREFLGDKSAFVRET